MNFYTFSIILFLQFANSVFGRWCAPNISVVEVIVLILGHHVHRLSMTLRLLGHVNGVTFVCSSKWHSFYRTNEQEPFNVPFFCRTSDKIFNYNHNLPHRSNSAFTPFPITYFIPSYCTTWKYVHFQAELSTK